VRGLNSWLDRNGKRVGIDVLGVVGLILIVCGIVQARRCLKVIGE
jgi:hypothetical protein